MCGIGEEEMETNQNLGPEIIDKGKGERVILGAVGAVVFSLLGVVLYCIIYQLGYLAGICGLAMVALGYWGYQLFSGRKKSLKGIIIATVVAVIMLAVAEYLALAISCYFELKEFDVTLTWVFQTGMPMAFEDPELKQEVLKEYGMSLLLCAVATVVYIVNTVKAIRTEKMAVQQDRQQ